MNLREEYAKGLFKQNPVFVQALAMCPMLAVTTTLENAFSMGMASTFVLVCANVFISVIKKFIPNEVRIPIQIVIVATFVTIVKLYMAAHYPALKEALGIYLPLIAVNCIIFCRIEVFARKNGPIATAADSLGMGIGFTIALVLVGAIREGLGTGNILGIPIADGLERYALLMFTLAPGGFLTLGLLLGLFNYLDLYHKPPAIDIPRHDAGENGNG